MVDRRLRVSVIGNASVAVEEVEQLPTLPHQAIYVEKAEFRDVMTINRVAVSVGLSVRQIRRMIESGAFPSSCVNRGQTQYWLRQTVRAWKENQLRPSSKRRSSRVASPSRWSDAFEIETEKEREFVLKATETQQLLNEVREMKALLLSDPAQLARANPKLKRWLKEKGLL